MRTWLGIFLVLVLASATAQKSAEEMAAGFFEAIGGDFEEFLDSVVPDNQTIRENWSENPNSSEEQVTEYRDGWKQYLRTKFQQVAEEASGYEMDMSLIVMGEIAQENIERGDGEILVGLRIPYTYLGKPSEFGLVALPVEDGFFLMDIPRSYGVFASLFE